MTAANSTPLSDGASAVLLASEEWAKERDLPILAYFAEAQTAAVDHVHKREGLLMAPAYAMPRMLDRAGLSLQDFDYYEIHEAFAAQVLCTLKAWEDPDFCKEKLGRDKPLGAIDREQAQRQRRLAGRRPPVRRDRRADRRRPRQATARRRQGPRRDQHLRRRRPGCRRHPRERQEVQANERPLLAGSQRARRLDDRQAARAAAAGRLDRHEPGAPVVSGPVLTGGAPDGRLGKTVAAFLDAIKAERAGAEGKAKALVFDATGIADSTELVELQRFFYPAVGRLQRSGRVVVLGTPPAEAGSAARPHRPAGAGGLHPLARQGDRRPRLDRAARLRRAGRRGPARLDPALPALAPLGLRLRAGGPDRQGRRAARRRSTGSGRSRASSRSSPAPRAGSARRSPTPSPATAPRSSASTSRRRPPTCSAVTGAIGGRLDRARHHRRGRPGADRRRARRTASTSSSTTPASPKTARSRRCRRSAGRS